jgi:hypothetical protein
MDALRKRLEEERRKKEHKHEQGQRQKIKEIASTIEPEEIQKFRDGMDAREEDDFIQVHRLKNGISAEEAKEPKKRAELLEEAVSFSLARRQLVQQEEEEEAERARGEREEEERDHDDSNPFNRTETRG